MYASNARACRKKSQDAVVQQLREAVAQLPPVYLRNLAYLMDFCALVAAHADQNKMSPANLAICIGPNLVPQRPAPPSPPPPVDWTFVVSPIAEQLIVHFDQVFPPGVPFLRPYELTMHRNQLIFAYSEYTYVFYSLLEYFEILRDSCRLFAST